MSAPAGTLPRGPARWVLVAAFLVCLAGLGAHVARYFFLTDDAFISFRYARNLADGYGLVFNPGGEAVEGYSNFLWVLLLAAGDRLGWKPEQASVVLSLLATLAIWLMVAHDAWRRPPPPGRAWLLLVPVALLAATRSFAVWATSGLETRWFEALVVGGALRLLVETEATEAGTPRRPLAVWLFALAALTRPDGMLFAGMALGAQAVRLAMRRRLAPGRWLIGLLPIVALVGGHFAFRIAYYGDWLPNTYYAKVGGRFWWDSGLDYLAAFALEYAAWLWVPLVATGIVALVRGGRGFRVALFAALIVPHAVYVASIGGDHFEYRPLDLYLPFLFLLVYDGAKHLARGAGRAWAVAAYLVVVLGGIWQIADRSHREFPSDYRSGFPGMSPPEQSAEARAFLDPARDPIYRLPGLSALAETHRRLLFELSTNFVALRQEEHRMFLETVTDQAGRIERLVEQGTLPADVHVAMNCVGAIPYYSDVRTLDRMGLTDAHVAHSPFLQRRFMFHDKGATLEYARERNVDLWAVDPVHTVVHVSDPRLMKAVRRALTYGDSGYAAYAGDDLYVLARLPQGLEAARRRMPELEFRWCGDPALTGPFVERGIAHFMALAERNPGDVPALRGLGSFLMVAGQGAPALQVFTYLAGVTPEVPDVWEHMAVCHALLGDLGRAEEVARRSAALSLAQGDSVSARRLEGIAAGYAGAAQRP